MTWRVHGAQYGDLSFVGHWVARMRKAEETTSDWKCDWLTYSVCEADFLQGNRVHLINQSINTLSERR